LLLTSPSKRDAERWVDLLDSLVNIPADHLQLIQEKADGSRIIREDRDIFVKVNLLLQKHDFDEVEISDWDAVDGEEPF